MLQGSVFVLEAEKKPSNLWCFQMTKTDVQPCCGEGGTARNLDRNLNLHESCVLSLVWKDFGLFILTQQHANTAFALLA